ncbi:hypothetical protein BV898_12142 [Hypsibius exemplaris]|uniref:Spondin domain-containing protein n=1 Tax=Hypsibius exemplaris TaxID=2072580 RepID=A0A1W0WEI1_HYPEX|nr:hypothetical protein BV898_12142 [Hypsibius exemplaris]
MVRSWFGLSLLTLWSLLSMWTGSSSGFRSECPPNSMAQYKMELRGTWQENFAAHSGLAQRGFPDRWRWATGIGVSLDGREDPHYNETIRMKIHSFVTKGGLSQTVSQLSQPGSGVLDSFLIPSLDSTDGETSAIFFIDSNHSRVSFMSRMNKKPHWILSVESVNLCQNGQFRDTFELDLFPFESKPRPSQQQQQHQRNHNGQTPLGPGAAYGKRSYSIVSPNQYNRGSLKGAFKGQTLVAPLPFPVQRETQHYATAAAASTSDTTLRQTLVAPVRLPVQTWKSVSNYSTALDLNDSLPIEAWSAVRNVLLSRPQTPDDKPSPELLSFHRKYSKDHTPRRSDPYMATATRTLPTSTRTPISSIFYSSSSTTTSSPVSFYLAPRAPTLSRRRLPPDSENEIPMVRRNVRSVRYGIKPRSRTSAIVTNASGTFRYPVPVPPPPPPPAYMQAPAPRTNYRSSSQHYPKNHSPVVFGPPRKAPLALPRLATAKFTRIASYHLSHLLALAKRRLRTGVELPLPITIDKAMINSPYLPYPAATGGRAGGNRMPSGMRGAAGQPTYDGMWPSPSNTAVQVVSPRRYHQPRHRQFDHNVRYVHTNQPTEML